MMKIKKILIGLEIHVELKTKSGMFCGCATDSFGKEPNTQTCPTCLGLPGALPVPNRRAIEMVILIGKALNCQTSPKSQFDRKNYFYPDLPKGYQISQHEFNLPFSTKGGLEIKTKNGPKRVSIRRVHLEEDTGKSIHTEVDGERVTLLDFNKSGVPLVEIVSDPDINSPEEAVIYSESVRKIIRYLDFSDCDLEKGQMRFEPTINLELEENGQTFFTPLVEIKNINSFRFLRKALEYEIDRQIRQIEKDRITKTSGNKMTRGYDQERMITFEQRHKEESEEYRYFPEPDIPPFEWKDDEISNFKLQVSKIELPDAKEKRFIKQYGLSEAVVMILTAEKSLADFYEEVVGIGEKENISPSEIANAIVNKRIDFQDLSPIELIKKIGECKTKFVLGEEEISSLAQEVVKENPKVIEEYKKGKVQVVGFLISLVQKKARGKADPRIVQNILLEKLKN